MYKSYAIVSPGGRATRRALDGDREKRRLGGDDDRQQTQGDDRAKKEGSHNPILPNTWDRCVLVTPVRSGRDRTGPF